MDCGQKAKSIARSPDLHPSLNATTAPRFVRTKPHQRGGSAAFFQRAFRTVRPVALLAQQDPTGLSGAGVASLQWRVARTTSEEAVGLAANCVPHPSETRDYFHAGP